MDTPSHVYLLPLEAQMDVFQNLVLDILNFSGSCTIYEEALAAGRRS
jgi:hypothetical protein